jgi:chromate transporter
MALGPDPGLRQRSALCHRCAMSHAIPIRTAARIWWRIALLSFGGPAGQIAVMHRILVEEQRWIDEARFLHALNFCMLLPGPEAQQLAIYIGWLLHRAKGGLIAGILFVVPGAVAIMVLSILYVLFGTVGPVAGFFFGLKAAVLAIVFDAVRRIGGRALKSSAQRIVAVAAFVALFVFKVPFPAIVLIAGLAGWLAAKRGYAGFSVGGHGEASGGFDDAGSALGAGLPDHANARGWSAWKLPLALFALWLLPTMLLFAILGPDSRYTEIASFFSRMAVVTFGGAYAVLAYVGQAAVEGFGWLSATEMLDGLGLAETTPGPLIMVTQFVGFLAGFRDPGAVSPLMGGVLGGLLTTWVTFVPCFVWIFAGAPYVERLRTNVALSSALSAITAAIVGVILNLAIWFALHFLFARQTIWQSGLIKMDLPEWSSFNGQACLLSVAAMIAIFWFRLGLFWVLGGCAIAGLVLHML